MRSLSFAAAVACLAAHADARLNWGTCPEYSRQPGFDTERYMGTWYSIKKNFMNLYEIGRTCTTQNWKLNDDSSVRFYNRSGGQGWFGGEMSYGGGMGKGVESMVDGPGSLVLAVSGEPDPQDEGDYNVIETDYETYALVYNCEETNFFWGWTLTREIFTILGRTPSPLPEKVIDRLEDRMREIVPNYDYYIVDVYQGEMCEYKPEPEDNPDEVSIEEENFLQNP